MIQRCEDSFGRLHFGLRVLIGLLAVLLLGEAPEGGPLGA